MSPPLLLWPVTLTFCSSLSHETRDLPQPFSPPLQTWTQSCVVLTFNSTELILTFGHILSVVGSKEANFRAAARYCCFDGAFNFPRSRPWTPFINIGNGLDHAAGLLTSFCQMFWPHASCLRDSNLDNFEVFRRTLLYNTNLLWGQVDQMHLQSAWPFYKMVIADCVVEHYDALF